MAKIKGEGEKSEGQEGQWWEKYTTANNPSPYWAGMRDDTISDEDLLKELRAGVFAGPEYRGYSKSYAAAKELLERRLAEDENL